MNLNERSPVTQLQVTAFVFCSNYAFHLIAEGITVWPFSSEVFLYDLLFCRYKALKSSTIFSMSLRTRVSDALHNLMLNDNFHCQAPWKNAKYDVFGSVKCQLANLIANRDWLIVTVVQAMACIFRQF